MPEHSQPCLTKVGLNMLCLDVNVLIDAFRADVPRHVAVHPWLDIARNDHEAVALLPEVALSFYGSLPTGGSGGSRPHLPPP